jgi:hypothetical protein
MSTNDDDQLDGSPQPEEDRLEGLVGFEEGTGETVGREHDRSLYGAGGGTPEESNSPQMNANKRKWLQQVAVFTRHCFRRPAGGGELVTSNDDGVEAVSLTRYLTSISQ